MAKGIEKVVEKFAVQTAIYWGNPQNNGFGGFTFDAPIDIACRWEDKMEVDFGRITEHGNTLITKAQVLLTQDVDIFGYLKLGSVNDYDSDDNISKPEKIEGAYVIRRFDKIPMVRKTDEFVRTAYLYEQGK